MLPPDCSTLYDKRKEDSLLQVTRVVAWQLNSRVARIQDGFANRHFRLAGTDQFN